MFFIAESLVKLDDVLLFILRAGARIARLGRLTFATVLIVYECILWPFEGLAFWEVSCDSAERNCFSSGYLLW